MKTFIASLCFVSLLICSCSKTEEPIDCSNSDLSISLLNKSDSPCGESNGSIEIASSGGTGSIQYTLDGITFQTNETFSNLGPGNYIVTVKDENGCEADIQVKIESGSSLDTDVFPLIQATCAVSGCHVSGNSREDFSIKENIIENANVIRTRIQNNSMPPANSGRDPLTSEQQEEVICWINDGARNN